MTNIVRDKDSLTFLNATKTLLYAEEATYSLMLGLSEGLRHGSAEARQAAVLIRILEGGRTVAAATQTPPFSLVLTRATTAQLEALADFLISNSVSFPGVVGPSETSERFAKIWSTRTNQSYKLGMGQKIYALESVVWPPSVAGKFRKATSEELELLTQWLVDFGCESLPPNEQKTMAERRPYVEAAIKKDYAHVWDVEGTAVSMAFVGRPTANGISVSGVYTPKASRKRGYASAVVAHLSQAMLDQGKNFCVLYTDLANPTSNKIYRDIGYREVAESKMFLFERI